MVTSAFVVGAPNPPYIGRIFTSQNENCWVLPDTQVPVWLLWSDLRLGAQVQAFVQQATQENVLLVSGADALKIPPSGALLGIQGPSNRQGRRRPTCEGARGAMSTLSVRISEDTRRPLGQAIITVAGLPRTLETCEFALRRHGCFANHLGPRGWQGAACWLAPEEAWYRGAALQFVLGAEQAYQLENMPYELALRGQGLDPPVATTFIWPQELDIEAADAAEPRQPLRGAQVRSQPQPAPPVEPEAVDAPPLPAALPAASTPAAELVSESAAPAPLASPPAIAPEAVPSAGSVTSAQRRARTWQSVLALLALLMLASGGIAWWLAAAPPVAREPLAVSPTPPSAIAPDRAVVLAPTSQPLSAPALPSPVPPARRESNVATSAPPVDVPPPPVSVKPTATPGAVEQALEALFQPDLQRELERELLRERR